MALPRFIVLKSNDKTDYMGYIHENGSSHRYVRFMEAQPESPYAKFEVETSDIDGLVHIRSYQTNKYLVRTQNLSITGNTAQQYWITATTDKPKIDQSKESCTLFKPISVDLTNSTVRIINIQSRCYLCLWQSSSNLAFTRCVLVSNKGYDINSYDIFKIIDWESLLVLPSPNWIWADSSDTSSNNKDTLFRLVKVDDETIALLNLGNNNFCKRLTIEGKTDCLNAATTSVTKYARLKVEEAIMTREYYNLKYNLDDGRVYNETALVVSRNSVSNYTQESSNLDVKLSYTDTKSSIWKNNLSLKLGMKSSMKFSLPLIFEGNLELSGEFQEVYEWGETTTETIVQEVVKKVVVSND
ncbi:hypothetical protein REPUB_Repub06bG0037800 [Reevesia pubescens]